MTPTMNTIDIVVSDLEAAMAFYARLGLEFTIDAYMPDHAGCDLPGGLHLMLDTEKARSAIATGWVSPEGSPRTFLAFEFPAPADVDAKHAELAGAGYRVLHEPWDAPWGMRYATVLDPDGTGIDLYAALPTG